MLILSVPILLLTWKMGGFKQKVLSSKLFIRSRYEYLEIKAEMLISHLIFIFWCQTQIFSVYSKNKGIGLTVPILLEGSVNTVVNIWSGSKKVHQSCPKTRTHFGFRTTLMKGFDPLHMLTIVYMCVCVYCYFHIFYSFLFSYLLVIIFKTIN